MTNTSANAAYEQTVRELTYLYDSYRNTLLNRKYYGYRLGAFQAWNRGLEVVIAFGGSAAVGSWVVWEQQVGSFAWAAVGGLTTLIAIAKPVFDLPARIERYSKLFVSYGDAYYDLREIVTRTTAGGLTPEQVGKYEAALARLRQLAANDDPRPNIRLASRCQTEVNSEIPAHTLWIPNQDAFTAERAK